MVKMCYKTALRKLKSNSETHISWQFCAKMLNSLHMFSSYLLLSLLLLQFFFVMRYETMSMVISIRCYFFSKWIVMLWCFTQCFFLFSISCFPSFFLSFIHSFSFFNIIFVVSFHRSVVPSMCFMPLWTNVPGSGYSRQFILLFSCLLSIVLSFSFTFFLSLRHFRGKSGSTLEFTDEEIYIHDLTL